MKTHPIYQMVETKMKREENLTAQHTVLRHICYVAHMIKCIVRNSE